MIAGDWGVGDDRRLIRALLKSGARMEFELDWAALVPGRSAKQALRRWRLMLRRIPNSSELDFFEQLEYLASTFTPDMWERYGSSEPAVSPVHGSKSAADDDMQQLAIEEASLPPIETAVPMSGVDDDEAEKDQANSEQAAHPAAAKREASEACETDSARLRRKKRKKKLKLENAEAAEAILHTDSATHKQTARMKKRKKPRTKGTSL